MSFSSMAIIPTLLATLQLLEYCLGNHKTSDKNLQLFCLPSGQTGKLLPLDSVPFGGVKDRFERYKDYHRILDSDFEVTILLSHCAAV